LKRALLIALLIGCGEESVSTPDAAAPDTQIPYQHLSKYGFFEGALADQKPAANVVPYDVNATLYQDDAKKARFLALPAGTKIGFDATGRWTWPDGATIIKTFYYDNPRRLLETRLLIYKGGIWTTHTYLWDDAQQEATRYLPGATITVGTRDYRVPSSQQCGFCHGESRLVVPLGPRTRQLNRTYDYGSGPENQLAHLSSLGMFDRVIPDPATLDKLADPTGSAAIEQRARSYLDANCGHCHNAEGQAKNTGLHLNWETTAATELGVCKPPVAAGSAAGNLFFDIVPGKPDQSILIFRMQATDAQIKMPQGPSISPDVTGAALVAQWIAGMPVQNCQ
jgi:uncharacterized repeat protein (TIGR03806 family)